MRGCNPWYDAGLMAWRLLRATVMVLVACGSSTSIGGVRVVTNVSEAILFVDDEERGPASAYEGHYIRLAPGPHRLALEHSEYVSEYIDVNVAEDVGMTVSIEMRRRSGTAVGPSSQEEGSRRDALPSTP